MADPYTLDVREEHIEVSRILFADKSNVACNLLIDRPKVQMIKLQGVHQEAFVLMRDVPNLIKALEKALELWQKPREGP